MQNNKNELAPWQKADLPEPPMPRGLSWIGVCGPGVIVLGVSIGSGEFLLGPATFVKHGLSLLWVTLVAVFFQTVFNTELMRYTVATGEPVVTGFMRTRPGKTFWAWFYAVLYFLQIGWPAWAATAAGAIFFLFAGRLATPPADATNYLPDRHRHVPRVHRACCWSANASRARSRSSTGCWWPAFSAASWCSASSTCPSEPGFRRWPASRASTPCTACSTSCPSIVDILLLGALVGYSGGGGVLNLTLSNWARDKGYGMGSRVGHIAGAVGGEKVQLADTGFMFEPDAANLARWRGWWRIVRVDQWGIFFVGALLGMMLPALLYVTFVATGTDIKGLAISAVLAQTIGATAGPWLGVVRRGARRVDPVQDPARLSSKA